MCPALSGARSFQDQTQFSTRRGGPGGESLKLSGCISSVRFSVTTDRLHGIRELGGWATGNWPAAMLTKRVRRPQDQFPTKKGRHLKAFHE